MSKGWWSSSVDCEGGALTNKSFRAVSAPSFSACRRNLPDTQILVWVRSYTASTPPALVSKQRERQLAFRSHHIFSSALPGIQTNSGGDERRRRRRRGVCCLSENMGRIRGRTLSFTQVCIGIKFAQFLHITVFQTTLTQNAKVFKTTWCVLYRLPSIVREVTWTFF